MIPTDGKSSNRESKVRVKALFDYNPDNDPYIPCKEAGLEFKKGEVLHIVSQVSFYNFTDKLNWRKFLLIFKDDHWWQARKEFDKLTRAGLIPSRSLQERRIIHERNQASKDNFENQSKSKYNCKWFILYDINTYQGMIKNI